MLMSRRISLFMFASLVLVVSIVAHSKVNVQRDISQTSRQDARSLSQLLTLPPERLATVSITRMNLLCGETFTPAPEQDVEQGTAIIAAWAKRVRSETERHYRFRNELAVFLSIRGMCSREKGRLAEAAESFTAAEGFIHGNIWHDHYWEAWFVKKDKTSPTTDSAAKYTDHVSWDGECGAVGSGGIQGTLKFFFASKIGNLGDPGASPPTSPDPSSGWTLKNSAPGSGDLPSTRNPRAVPWWNDSSDNGQASATRSVTVSWDCSCKCEKDKSTISASR
jgi:hypothetical protein